MKEEIGLMEQEIVQEENLEASGQKPPEAQKREQPRSKAPIKILTAARLKQLIFSLRKPKITTLIILFVLILLVYFALLLIATQDQQELPQLPLLPTATNNLTASPDSKLITITQRVKTYNNIIANLQDFQTDLSLPTVDLEISFEE